MIGQGAGLRARIVVDMQRNKNSHNNEHKSSDEKNMLLKSQKKYADFLSGVSASANIQRAALRHHNAHRLGSGDHDQKLTPKYVIHPEDINKIQWDMFMGIIIFYSLVTIPYMIGFKLSGNLTYDIAEYIIDMLFLIDLVLNFLTAYVDPTNEKLITDHKSIAQNYMKFWFWVDLVSTIPFESLFSSGDNKLKSVRLIRILRLARLFKLARFIKLGKLQAHLEKLDINPALMNVVKLILQIFFIAHLISCFWFFLTTNTVTGVDQPSLTASDYPAARTWATEFGFDQIPVVDQYVGSFYWTIATMLSVGYGDIHATNNVERVYTIITMLCGGVMFGAVIAQVTRLIETRNPQARAFKEKMDEIKAYLSEKPLPETLKKRAKVAYAYYLQRKSSFGETGIFDSLPRHLLIRLVKSIYEREVRRITLFRTGDPSFVVDLVMNCRPFQGLRGEVIYREGDMAEDVIFIMRGLVKLTIHDGNHNVIVGYAKEKGYFGDFEYFKKSTRLTNAICSTNSSFLSISNSTLDDICENHFDPSSVLMSEMKARYDAFQEVLKAEKRHMDIVNMNGKQVITEKSVQWIDGEICQPSDIDRNIDGFFVNNSALYRVIIPNIHFNKKLYDSIMEDATERSRQRDRVMNLSVSKMVRHLDNHGDTKHKENPDSNTENNNNSQMRSSSNHRLNSPSADDNVIKPLGSMKLGNNDNNNSNAIASNSLSFNGPLTPEILVEETMEQIGKRMLFHPQGVFKMYWDSFVGLLIVYSVLMIPVQIGFSVDDNPIFEHIVDSMFFLDIIFSLRTSYYSEDDDAWVLVPERIMWGYLKSWFLIDFFSSIPFDTVISVVFKSSIHGLNSIKLLKTFRLARLLKLARLMKLTKYINRLEDLLGISPSVFDLMKMIMEVVFIGHITACCWWGLSSLMTEYAWYEDTSMVYTNLKYASLTDRYVTSLYWTFTTLTTVGYGDITPVNTAERVVNIFIMIMGATVFGYIVANVSSLMGTLNQTEVKINEKISEVTEFLNEKNCPKLLAGGIIRHFRHLFNQTSVFDEDGILTRLPRSISNEIQFLTHADKLTRITLFRFIPNHNVILFIFKLLHSEYYDSNQYIVRYNEMATEILFLVTGKAMIYIPDRERRVHKLKQRRLRKETILKKSFSGNAQGGHYMVGKEVVVKDSTVADMMKPQKSTGNIQLTPTSSWKSASVKSSGRNVDTNHNKTGEIATDNNDCNDTQMVPNSPTTMETTDNLDNNKLFSNGDSQQNDNVNKSLRFSDRNNAENSDNAKQREVSEMNRSLRNQSPSTVINEGNSMQKSMSKGSPLGSKLDGGHLGHVDHEKLGNAMKHKHHSMNLAKPGGQTNTMRHAMSERIGRKKLDLVESDESTDEDDRVTQQRRREQKRLKKKQQGKKTNSKNSKSKSDSEDEDDEESQDDTRRYTQTNKMSGKPNSSEASEIVEARMRRRGYIPIGEITAGDFLGHVAMLNHGRHSAAVRAIEPCAVYSLRRSTLNSMILKEHSNVGLVLQSALGEAIFTQNKELARIFVRQSRAAFLRQAKADFNKVKESKMTNGALGNQTHSTMSNGRRIAIRIQAISNSIGIGTGSNNNQNGRRGAMIGGNHINANIRSKPTPSTPSVLPSTSLAQGVRTMASTIGILPSGHSRGHGKSGPRCDEQGNLVLKPDSKWHIVRQAIRDARVTATVAKMTENRMKESNSNSSNSNGNQAVRNSNSNSNSKPKPKPAAEKTSMFMKAMHARIGKSIENILSETSIVYDSEEELSYSDDDEFNNNDNAGNSEVSAKGGSSRSSRRRSSSSLNDLSNINNSTRGKRSKKSVSASIKAAVFAATANISGKFGFIFAENSSIKSNKSVNSNKNSGDQKGKNATHLLHPLSLHSSNEDWDYVRRRAMISKHRSCSDLQLAHSNDPYFRKLIKDDRNPMEKTGSRRMGRRHSGTHANQNNHGQGIVNRPRRQSYPSLEIEEWKQRRNETVRI